MNIMDGVTAISGIILVACMSVLLLEQSRKGRVQISLNLGESKGLVVINIILWVLSIQALLIVVLDYTGILFSDTHLLYAIVGIPPTVGWGVVFTRIVQGKEPSHQQHLDGLAHLIALKAMKSETPETALLDLIHNEKKSGQLTDQSAHDLVCLISNRTDSIGAYARKILESAKY